MSYHNYFYGSKDPEPDQQIKQDDNNLIDLDEFVEETEDEFGGCVINLEELPEEVKYLYVVRF